ncbi:MAG: hypothetical protein IID44_17795 [Planctomycetes bacterium]|nr:hypothetical protein [Planctomycetota bacterium]
MMRLMLLGQILAQQGGYGDMGSKLHGRRARWETSDMLIASAVMVAIVLGIWMLARIAARQDKGQRMNNPWALFRSLAKVHDLDRPSRRMLKQLAVWQRLEHPGRLFVEPERFETVNLSPDLQSQAPAVLALRNRIFGDISTFGSGETQATPAT